jgi:hypothetical protein
MKANYGKWFLWSSLGSLAVGTAVALARRSRKVERPPLSCRKVPHGCREIVLWTERFEIEEHGARRFVHDRYVLQPTSFRIWSFLDLPSTVRRGGASARGAAVFHVTRTRIADGDEGNSMREALLPLDRFYGTVAVVDPRSGVSCPGGLARGGILEIRKCYVGGSSNGVESGDIHRSSAPILNFRIIGEPVWTGGGPSSC